MVLPRLPAKLLIIPVTVGPGLSSVPASILCPFLLASTTLYYQVTHVRGFGQGNFVHSVIQAFGLQMARLLAILKGKH